MRDQVAGPHRLVEDDGVVGHHRLGQLEALLQVEVHLQRQLLGSVRPGRPVVRAEPHREHRRRRDRAAGDLVGDVVVPEQRVAVLDRRARWSRCSRARPGTRRPPRTAPRRSAPRRRPAARRGGVAHAITPASCSWPARPPTRPAPVSSSSVSVTVASRTSYGLGRGVPCPRAPDPPVGTSPCSGACAVDERRRGPRTARRRPISGDGQHRRHAGVGRAELARPTRRGPGSANTRAQVGADLRPAPRRRVWCGDPLLAAERAAQVGPEVRLDGGDREPLAVAQRYDVVAGVAAGEQVVARARAPSPVARYSSTCERHERRARRRRPTRRGTRPRRWRRAAPARRGSPSPRACRRRRCRRRSRPGAAGRRRRRGPEQSR